MDPMDYVVHSHPRLSHSDPSMYASPGNWMHHGHPPVPSSPWPSHPPIAPQHYHYQRPYQMNSHHFQFGQNGGLPSPDPAVRGYPLPDPVSILPIHHRPWAHGFQPMPGPTPVPIQQNHMNMPDASVELPFGLMTPAGSRGMFLQSPGGEPGLGLPGATLESHPMPPHVLFPQLPEHLVNAPGQQIANPPFSIPPRMNTAPSRRVNHASSSTPRAPRAVVPSPSFGPLPHHELSSAHRRSGHSRARRSVNPRLTMSDPSADIDDEGGHDHGLGGSGHHRTSHSSSGHAADDGAVRQMQVLRGSMSSKMIVSKVALQSLQSVKIGDLPGNERTCVICYNDYGVETPEGINEAPLQLPKCKHVFGDYCIKKWFEDSDSCPYCRDKLHSEPKHHFSISSTRAFMSMMRVRGQLPPGTTDEMYLRLMTGLAQDEREMTDSALRQLDSVDRRSLLDGENPRRTRPRRGIRDMDSSTVENENLTSASSASTTSSPSRISSREPTQFPQWMARTAQHRASLAALNQQAEARERRRQGSHSHFPVGAVMTTSMNMDASPPNSLQPPQSDGVNRTGVTSLGANAESIERITSVAGLERQNGDPSAEQNRNRLW